MLPKEKGFPIRWEPLLRSNRWTLDYAVGQHRVSDLHKTAHIGTL